MSFRIGCVYAAGLDAAAGGGAPKTPPETVEPSGRVKTTEGKPMPTPATVGTWGRAPTSAIEEILNYRYYSLVISSTRIRSNLPLLLIMMAAIRTKLTKRIVLNFAIFSFSFECFPYSLEDARNAFDTLQVIPRCLYTNQFR